MKRPPSLLLIVVLASLASCGPGGNQAPSVTRPREGGSEIDPPAGGFRAVAGQTIYVPVYSSIFTSDSPQNFNLSVTLSIRNPDQAHPIVVTTIRYFDHDGKLIQDYLKKPLRVGPMAAVELFVREQDTSGGISANFLVEWLSEEPVASPIVESVMVGTASSQGISFTSSGRVIADRTKPAPTATESR
jgi:Protein of unknown function (DUF3124)